MFRIKQLFGFLIFSNVFILFLVLNASRYFSQYDKSQEPDPSAVMKQAYALRPEGFISIPEINQESISELRNYFELLGAYPEILLKYFNSYPDKTIEYNTTDHGLFNDDDYCQRVDNYNLEHPENLFEQRNFFTDYASNTDEAMPRDLVMKAIGNINLPEVSIIMNASDFYSRKYHLPVEINTFFTKRVDLHQFHQIGKHFLCATQMYNHIPGHGVLKRKDLIVETVKQYAKRFTKRPHCFDKNKFFPLSYRLNNKQECEEFFKIITSRKYKKSLAAEPIQYLLKVGVGSHRALGVSLVDKEKTKFLLDKYKNGTDCGTNVESYVAQTYISNPLLLDKKNKFDFRIYMLVASTNPLIVYYHDGLIKASLTTYDKHSKDEKLMYYKRGAHLTNLYLSRQKFGDDPNKTVNGMTRDEAEDYMLWSFKELEQYLLESGKVRDRNWLNNYLRPAFRRSFVHAARMSQGSFWNQSNVYELFGLDYMLDDKMNLWLLECNSSPQLLESNGKEFMVGMMMDMFEIEYAYYRSRMKRVMKMIKKIQREEEVTGRLDIKKWRKEYKIASKNRLEPEFKIRKNNSFTLVVDENLPAGAAYFGNIPSECV